MVHVYFIEVVHLYLFLSLSCVCVCVLRQWITINQWNVVPSVLTHIVVINMLQLNSKKYNSLRSSYAAVKFNSLEFHKIRLPCDFEIANHFLYKMHIYSSATNIYRTFLNKFNILGHIQINSILWYVLPANKASLKKTRKHS